MNVLRDNIKLRWTFRGQHKPGSVALGAASGVAGRDTAGIGALEVIYGPGALLWGRAGKQDWAGLIAIQYDLHYCRSDKLPQQGAATYPPPPWDHLAGISPLRRPWIPYFVGFRLGPEGLHFSRSG